MNADQQFYLQLVSEILTALTPILLGAFGLWLKSRMNKQDADRATKADQTQAAIHDAKTAVIDKVATTAQNPIVTVNVKGDGNEPTTPAVDSSQSPL